MWLDLSKLQSTEPDHRARVNLDEFRHDPRDTVDRLLEKFLIPLEPEH